MSDPNWLTYTNQNKVRNQPLSAELISALGFLGEMGLGAEVFSGGQPAKGTSSRRVGSTRHDHGHAADLFLTRNGQRLTWENPEHLPIFSEVVRRAKANGITGIGAGPGYMAPGSMHIGFGAPAVWGDNGAGVNAPDWLVEAYGAVPQGPQPRVPIVPQQPVQGAQGPQLPSAEPEGKVTAATIAEAFKNVGQQAQPAPMMPAMQPQFQPVNFQPIGPGIQAQESPIERAARAYQQLQRNRRGMFS